jgi:hypothetical protein
MHRYATSRWARPGIVVVLSLSIMAGPAIAQMQQPAPPYGAAPHTAPAEKSPPYRVEGAVKEVDPGAQTVKISTGLFGIMRRTLDVDEQTLIHVDGRQATIADIREGTQVKAAYEPREGKNVALLIEIMPRAQSAPSSTLGSGTGTK